MKKILQRCMAGLLTAVLCSGGVYAAETVTPITTQLDLTNAANDLTGNKYSWDGTTLTLEDGFAIDVSGDAIKLPAGATVNVLGNVTIISNDDCIDGAGALQVNLAENATLTLKAGSDGIHTSGDLTVKGVNHNSKVFVCSNTSSESYCDDEGLDAKNIRIEKCYVDITSGDECLDASKNIAIINSVLDLYSDGDEAILASDGNVTINNSTVNANADDEVIQGSTITITDSKLDVKSQDGNPIFYATFPDDYDNYFDTKEEVVAAFLEYQKNNIHIDAKFNLYDKEGILLTEDPIYYTEDLMNPDVYEINDDRDDFCFLYNGIQVHRLVTVEDIERNIAYNTPKMPFLCALNVKVGEGGSANASGSLLIAKYATRLLRFTADDGYEIADVLVNGKSVGAVSSYKVGPATANTTVEVRFAPIVLDTSVEAPADAAVDAEDDLDDDE